MMRKESENYEESNLMKRRRIILADGRYMIFYTFDKSLSPENESETRKIEPHPQPEATEEKNV